MKREGVLRAGRRRRAAFMLTPLVDVIFLLLIFFMLSSQIAPYAVIPIGGASFEPSPAAVAPAQDRPAIVRVGAGIVVLDGRSLPAREAGAAIAELARSGTQSFLVVTLRTATVQDVTSVLEALERNATGRVTLLPSGGGS